MAKDNRVESKPIAQKKWRRRWFELLAEARKAYPESPTLCRIEAQGPSSENGRFDRIWSSYRYQYPNKDLFSADTRRRLALFVQGAAMTPGAEEQAWLDESPDVRQRGDRRYVVFWGSRWGRGLRKKKPSRACAQQAIFILNRQADKRIDDKAFDAAQKTFRRILGLLPKACMACGEVPPPEDGTESKGKLEIGLYSWNSGHNQSAVRQAMQNLYRFHVTVLKNPEGYLELAEDWKSRLCPHQQEAIENALQAIRLELQYMKDWRITYEGQMQNYHGDFFDRYVNLDAFLGQPDDCSVTAECVLDVPTARDAVLRVGFDHRLQMELNGQEIFEPRNRKIAVRDEFTIAIKLKAGKNTLTLTLADDKLAYGFFLRLSDPAGDYMKDITIR